MNQLELLTLARADRKLPNVVGFSVASMLDHLKRISESKADLATRQAAVMELVAEELLKHKEPSHARSNAQPEQSPRSESA